MKSIPIEQLGERLSKAIEQQDKREAIGLTTGGGTVAWIVRVPEFLRTTEADVSLYDRGPGNGVLVVVDAKHDSRTVPAPKPTFGAGRDTLSIMSDGEEYLRDFEEYMK